MLKLFSSVPPRVLILALFALLIMAAAVPAFAQTPVPIVINTNAFFTQTNTWIGVFDDIIAIGIGISIAIAILVFIGAQILKAFKGAGGR